MGAKAQQDEVDDLRRRLQEAEETIEAIRDGAVDALVVAGGGAPRVYTLEGAERPYRLLIERMQQGALTLSADGTVVYANARCAEMLGVPPGRLTGSGLRDFVAPADRPAYDRLLADGLAGASRGELLLAKGGAAAVPALATFAALPADSGAAVGVVITDLTAQKHQEALAAAHAALRDSEERLQLAVAAAKLGQWALDLRSAELTCSPVCKTNFGRPPDGPFSYDDMWQAIHPDDRERVRLRFAQAVEAREDYEAEFRAVCPDGETRWVLSRGRASYDDAGAPLRMAGVTLDITGRKRAEEALAAADRRKDEFLATLAHELRNPLAPLSNGLEIVRLSPDRQAREQARGMMERQLGQLVRLVDDLLDVSRITRDRLELRPERVELASVLTTAVESARPLLAASGHRLTVSLPGRPVWLDADPARLAQVVANLLNNANKYTPAGGRIALSAEEVGGAVTVSVTDSGIGLAAGMLARVFDMFTQVDGSIERSQGGLGIGLTLVKRLVELHGGTVEAASPGLGLGSTFTVRLTAAAAPPSAAQAAATTPPAPLKVLIVDDNVDSALSLGMLLRIAGHDIRTAHDGPAGLREAAGGLPDVALLDIGMPGMSGYEVARAVRALPGGGRVVLIAVTGWGQEDARRQASECGFDHHLTKPVDLDELARLLAAARR